MKTTILNLTTLCMTDPHNQKQINTQQYNRRINAKKLHTNQFQTNQHSPQRNPLIKISPASIKKTHP